jgi:hypothetical protein
LTEENERCFCIAVGNDGDAADLGAVEFDERHLGECRVYITRETQKEEATYVRREKSIYGIGIASLAKGEAQPSACAHPEEVSV